MGEQLGLIILGAGPSGVAAATRLLEKGYTNFIVLEASERIGGRVYSAPFGEGVVDIGAEWCHGEVGNVVHKLAAPYDLLFDGGNPFETSQLFLSDGTLIDKQLFASLQEILTEILVDSKEEMKTATGSVGKFFEERYWPRVEPLIETGKTTRAQAEDFLKFFEKWENSEDGSSSWYETSIKGLVEYSDCPGNIGLAWKFGGYNTILDILTKKIPNPNKKLPLEAKVFLQKVVTKVNWTTDVVVTCADGSQYTADRVLCTLPLNVLKATADQIFEPSLPDRNLRAIQGLGMGTVDRICLDFPYRWWPAGSGGFSIVWTAEDSAKVPANLSWTTGVFGFYRSDRQPLTLLCGWIVGKEAEEMETHSDEEVKEACMDLLRRFINAGDEIPEPVGVKVTRWHTNPYARGSYSCRVLESDKLDVYPRDLGAFVTNKDGKEVILFAGEATNDTHFSTVHGAIETGWREAERFLNFGGRKDSTSERSILTETSPDTLNMSDILRNFVIIDHVTSTN